MRWFGVPRVYDLEMFPSFTDFIQYNRHIMPQISTWLLLLKHWHLIFDFWPVIWSQNISYFPPDHSHFPPLLHILSGCCLSQGRRSSETLNHCRNRTSTWPSWTKFARRARKERRKCGEWMRGEIRRRRKRGMRRGRRARRRDQRRRIWSSGPRFVVWILFLN